MCAYLNAISVLYVHLYQPTTSTGAVSETVCIIYPFVLDYLLNHRRPLSIARYTIILGLNQSDANINSNNTTQLRCGDN